MDRRKVAGGNLTTAKDCNIFILIILKENKILGKNPIFISKHVFKIVRVKFLYFTQSFGYPKCSSSFWLQQYIY